MKNTSSIKNPAPSKLLLLCTSLLLVGCASDGATSGGSSTGSATSDSAPASRLSVQELLNKFSAHNGTNYATFDLLAASNQKSTTSADLSSTKPAYFAYYQANGYEFDFDASSGWSTSLSNFGYLDVPTGMKEEAGAYPYTVLTSKSGLKSMELGNKASVASVYDYATPAYLANNATRLAPLFATTSKESINTLSDKTEVVACAKALSVYGPLSKALPDLVFDSIDLEYTAASTAYNFKVYAYLNSADAALANPAKRYLAATASLRNFGKTSVPLLTAYPNKVTSVGLDAVSITNGASTTLTAYLTGGQYDHIKWSVDPVDTTVIATLSSESTSGQTVSLTASAVGTSKIHASVYSAANEDSTTLLATTSTTLKVA